MKILRMALMTLIPAIAVAQQPASGSLRGIVVKVGTNDPLPNAAVELRVVSGTGAEVATTTDAGGTFVFPKIPPGTYRASATRAGYVRSEYGQRKPGGPPLAIAVGAGETASGIRIEMTPGGVISGRVTDSGQPVGQAHVLAVKSTYNDGLRTMTPVLSSRTDDRGEYHIFWLPPGEYYIVAAILDIFDTAIAGPTSTVIVNPDGPERGSTSVFVAARTSNRAVLNRAIGNGAGENRMHVPMYFPGTPEWQRAISIDVRPGAETRDVNIDASPVPVWRVRGTVTGMLPINDAGGRPVRPIIGLERRESPFPLINQPDQIIVTLQPNNLFEIARVAPGSYTLTAAQPGGNATRINIEVRDRDLVGISLAMDQRLTLSGRIIVEPPAAATSLPPVTDLRVSLRSDPPAANMISIPAPTKPDGSFNIVSLGGNRALTPLDYRVSVGPILLPPTATGNTLPSIPQAWRNVYVKSIRLGDADVLNGGLQLRGQPQEELIVVIGTNPGAIEGRVLDVRRPIPTATVVLIPDGGIRFRVDHRFTSTDAEGRFQLQSIPPGDYKVFAWEEVENGAWQDPDFVRDYEGLGKPIRIEEGGKHASFEVAVIPEKP